MSDINRRRYTEDEIWASGEFVDHSVPMGNYYPESAVRELARLLHGMRSFAPVEYHGTIDNCLTHYKDLLNEE